MLALVHVDVFLYLLVILQVPTKQIMHMYYLTMIITLWGFIFLSWRVILNVSLWAKFPLCPFKAFFAQDISITFGNYRRPGQIKVEKSTDFGATFTPWHYLVTPPASSQCSRQFRVEAQSVISRVNQVLCTEYAEYVPLEFNETVSNRHGE